MNYQKYPLRQNSFCLEYNSVFAVLVAAFCSWYLQIPRVAVMTKH